MNNLFRQNVQVLRQTHPGLADIIEKTPHKPRFLPEAESKRRWAAARAAWAKAPVRRKAMFIALGLDHGHDVAAWMERPEADAIYAYILIQSSLIDFIDLLHTVDITGWFKRPRVFFAVGIPEDMMMPYLGKILAQGGLLFTMISNAFTLSDAHEYSQHRAYYDLVSPAIREAVRFILKRRQCNFLHAEESIRNRMINADEPRRWPSVQVLRQRFVGKPAIIVSAGPSLDKNVHLLKEVRGRAIVIATNTVLGKLIRLGTPPHIVCSMDSTPKLVPYYEGLPPGSTKNIVLASTPSIDPRIFELFEGPRVLAFGSAENTVFVDSDVFIRSTVDDEGEYQDVKMSIGGSCAHTAYGLAALMGCSPIILIGQDLAYSLDGQTHTTDVNFQEGYGITKREFLAEKVTEDIWVMGNDGNPILTNDMWKACGHEFSRLIEEKQIRTINATEGGARIVGAEVSTLKEVIQTWLAAQEEFDMGTLLQLIDRQFDSVPIRSRKEIGDCIIRPALRAIRNLHVDLSQILYTLVLAQNNRPNVWPTAVQQSLQYCADVWEDEQVRRWTLGAMNTLVATMMIDHHRVTGTVADRGPMYDKLLVAHMHLYRTAIDEMLRLRDAYAEGLQEAV